MLCSSCQDVLLDVVPSVCPIMKCVTEEDKGKSGKLSNGGRGRQGQSHVRKRAEKSGFLRHCCGLVRRVIGTVTGRGHRSGLDTREKRSRGTRRRGKLSESRARGMEVHRPLIPVSNETIEDTVELRNCKGKNIDSWWITDNGQRHEPNPRRIAPGFRLEATRPCTKQRPHSAFPAR